MSQNGGEGKEGGKIKFSFGRLQKPIQPIGKGLASKKANEDSITKSNAFGGEDEEDVDLLKTKSADSITNKNKGKSAGNPASSKSARARQEAALSLDSSIFDYDGVYDSMKEGREALLKKRKEEDQNRDPKYMNASFAASEQRRLDRQIAEAKKIQRERELEGDLYENTESFVTEAYKKQMEEMQKIEQKEEEDERRNSKKKGKGVAKFYQNMLNEQDLAHQAAVTASLQSIDAKEIDKTDDQTEDTRKRSRIEDARKKGLDVRTNDDNEVVDERSLLSAGLNTFSNKNKKPRAQDDSSAQKSNQEDKSRHYGSERDHYHSNRTKESQRERQSRAIEEQMLALQQKQEEEEREREAERKRNIVGQRRNNAERIEQARQRALERRKKRDEEENSIRLDNVEMKHA